jgi:hypothetical protein
MSAATIEQSAVDSVETRLRDELVQGDAMLSGAPILLRHLLLNDDPALFTDQVLASVREMLTDVARQLLRARAEAGRIADPASFVADSEDGLVQQLANEPTLLTHVHAMAIEAGLALKLQARCNIDPVLCPLLQELVASRDDSVAGTAMAVLAAQARFVQHHRRMSLPLGELPGDLLHLALLAMRAAAGEREVGAVAAERAVRDAFDEGRGRLALISRLIMRTGALDPRTLDLGQAGLAIFASAVASASRQPRDPTVLSLSSHRLARLGLALRVAGLEQPAIEAQVLYLDPAAVLPEGFEELDAERAAMLLAASRRDG